MGNSAILAIPQVGENQNNKYITVNDAITALENVTQNYLAFPAVGGVDVVLSDAESTGYMFYEVSGATANFDLIIKSVNVDAQSLRRFFVVKNLDTTYTCTVGTNVVGTTVNILPGHKALLQQRGVDIVLIGYFNDAMAGPLPYDVGIFIPGMTANNQVCLQLTAVRAFRFPDDFAGSDANVGTNPAASAVFTVAKNGVSIGTVTFDTAGAPTFATTGTGFETFAAGDILRITSQPVADGSMANISITLKGERV
jgi:hypothetical protein